MTRLSALAAITTVDLADILHVASDPGGANLDKKITVANFILSAGVIINAPATSAKNTIQPSDAAVVPLILKGAVSQTGNLLQFQNSAGTPLSYFRHNGELWLTDIGGGATPLRIMDSSSNLKAYFNGSGGFIQQGVNATVGSTTPAVPSWQMFRTYWNGSASVSEQMAMGISQFNASSGGFAFRFQDQFSTYPLSIAGKGGQVSVGYESPSEALLTSLGQLHVRALAATSIGMTIQGASSQSADLFRVQSSTPVTLFSVSAAGIVTAKVEDATTGGVTNVLTLSHNTTTVAGAGATNLGTGILFQGESDSTPDSSMGRIRAYWNLATHASRRGAITLSVYDTTTEVDVIRMITGGSGTGYVGIMVNPDTNYVLNVSTNARISGSNPALYAYDTIQGDNKRVIVQMDATNNVGVIQTTYSTGGPFPLIVKVVNEEVARFGGAEIAFNEEGNDNDFRVEGDTDANLFFTDAGNDRVGIGMNNPAQKLDVTGNVKFGAASGAAGSRIIARGEHTSAPAGTLSAGEWELSVYDNGTTPVFRIRYNDGGVEKTGNVTLA